jgi:thymidylate kinase
MLPNLLVPAMRRLLPSYKSSHIEAQNSTMGGSEKPGKAFPLIFAVRSVLLAYDRRSLLTKAFKRAANGAIVLCDRYPVESEGTPDGPQLLNLLADPARYPVRHLLARIEEKLYREIPPADLVISLSVPVEVAILRNKNRGKVEPEDFVRMRHARSDGLQYGRTPAYKVDTNRPFEETVLEVKRAVWKIL